MRQTSQKCIKIANMRKTSQNIVNKCFCDVSKTLDFTMFAQSKTIQKQTFLRCCENYLFLQCVRDKNIAKQTFCDVSKTACFTMLRDQNIAKQMFLRRFENHLFLQCLRVQETLQKQTFLRRFDNRWVPKTN